MRVGRNAFWSTWVVAAIVIVAPLGALAQTGPLKLDLPGVGEKLGSKKLDHPVTVSAQFSAPAEGQPARLFVSARIASGYHIYSLTQGVSDKGGPLKTVIRVNPSEEFRLVGDFEPTTPPQTHIDTEAWPGLKLEEHYESVTWHAPLELAAGVDPSTLKIAGKVDVQACDAKGCLPPKELSFTASLATDVKSLPTIPAKASSTAPSPATGGPATATSQSIGEYRAKDSKVLIRGQAVPATVAPGGTVTLSITAVPDKGWHVYALAKQDPKVVGKGTPTLIALEGNDAIQQVSASARPAEKPSAAKGGGVDAYHAEPVTWTLVVKVPAGAAPGPYPLTGIIGYQVCTDKNCEVPLAARFAANLTIDGTADPAPVPLSFSEAKYGEAARLAATRPGAWLAVRYGNEGMASATELVWMIFLGLMGGLVLNLMPCVLPVIGLKILSFIEQAGQDRREALALNVWYSVGILAVFMALATTAVTLGLAWGEQFGRDAFSISLSAVVFAMSLSLLGVWEIPLPGFVGGSTAHMMSAKEGPAGAVFKGVLTTLLATPCTGPFMGTALAWSVRQPAVVTYVVFASIAIGMALPYLIVGAFPGLIRFLPKPGAWMATFKQVMGFVLLGTVIFLMSFIHPALLVQTVTLFAGVGLACWWISRTPTYADYSKQIFAWIQGAAVVVGIALFAFGPLDGVMQARFSKYAADTGSSHAVGKNALAWQPYSASKLQELSASGKTIMVDFTADWCPNCKTLEAFVLNTKEVKDFVEHNRVVPLVADFTRFPPEIKTLLEELQSEILPVLAIFPEGKLDQPIVFRGLYSQSELLDALRKAGPSREVEAAPQATAMSE